AERRKSTTDRGDLLSMLIGARDAETGESMDDRQLRDEAMTIFLAGHETTADALTFTSLLLSRYPAALRVLRAGLAEALRARGPSVAFGAGPRLVIGSGCGSVEAELVLATMAQRIRFELVPGADVELDPSITLRPRHGVRMRVR